VARPAPLPDGGRRTAISAPVGGHLRTLAQQRHCPPSELDYDEVAFARRGEGFTVRPRGMARIEAGVTPPRRGQ
jgi:hypothetical protein